MDLETITALLGMLLWLFLNVDTVTSSLTCIDNAQCAAHTDPLRYCEELDRSADFGLCHMCPDVSEHCDDHHNCLIRCFATFISGTTPPPVTRQDPAETTAQADPGQPGYWTLFATLSIVGAVVFPAAVFVLLFCLCSNNPRLKRLRKRFNPIRRLRQKLIAGKSSQADTSQPGYKSEIAVPGLSEVNRLLQGVPLEEPERDLKGITDAKNEAAQDTPV